MEEKRKNANYKTSSEHDSIWLLLKLIIVRHLFVWDKAKKEESG
ncbi:hypothetical protein QS460_03750 [Liquorilactobacillus mali]|nr:hypothetical protein [Liquorilactobacillus mali]